MGTFMDEAVDAVKMGVALILFTALLAIVIFNTGLGRNMLNTFIEGMDSGTTREVKKSFAAFTGDGKLLTAAGAYAFIGYNENHIKSVTCYMHGGSGEVATGQADTCLKTHLSGNVILCADYDDTAGQYELEIYPET